MPNSLHHTQKPPGTFRRRYDLVVFDDQNPEYKQATRPQRATTSTGLTPYAGPWGEKQVTHLLKRTLFGVKRAEVNQFTNLDINEAIDRLVSASPLHDVPINDYYNETDELGEYESYYDVSPGEAWGRAHQYWPVSFFRIMSLKGWWIRNIVVTFVFA
jgi:hypothetical protein